MEKGSKRRGDRRGVALTALLAISGAAADTPAPSPVTSIPLPRPRVPAPSSRPSAIPLPRPIVDPTSTRTEKVPLGEPLVPGQLIQPIDLASALRLAGARDLDIAIAREQIAVALADLEQSRVLLIPSLFLGPSWIRHDGQVQTVQGPVQSISKSSLFLGATAAAGSSVSGPVPAGGPSQVSGLTSILRISDAIFQPLAARRVVAARRAGLQVATNDALLTVAEAYLDLQLAAGRLNIAREAERNASRLTEITGSYARAGQGLEADHERSLTERDRQRRNIEAAVGQLEIASAELVRLLHLDPQIVVAPVEPPVTILRLCPDNPPLDDLIVQALHQRPELAEAQALVEATLTRLKEAKLRPLIPSVALTYSGGGFGGGVNGFFGNFGARSDAAVNLFWELNHLGLGDRAVMHGRAAEQRVALLQLVKTQDRVAADVVSAYKQRIASSRQVDDSGRSVDAALRSFEQNLARIQRAAGLPLEVLQPIQALAQVRGDYLEAVLSYNRSQFRLRRAIGQP